MNTIINKGIWIFQDSLASVPVQIEESVIESTSDTASKYIPAGQNEIQPISNTSEPSNTPLTQTQQSSVAIRRQQTQERIQPVRERQESNEEQQKLDSAKSVRYETDFEDFSLYRKKLGLVSYKPQSGWSGMHTELRGERIDFKEKVSVRNQLNWTLIIGLFSLLILLYLKTFFQKFVFKVINTLVNFQLADTMLREKNAVVRRAFFLMNLNFILVLSLFVMLFARYFEFRKYDQTFHEFLYILAIIIAVVLIRLVLYYIVGFVFEWRSAVKNQLHANYLINKNLGIFLLPLVFIAIYTNPAYSGIILFCGATILILGTIYRIVRGFQIIIKNGVLILYAILYLCTLELLPIVLGSKFIISLR